MDTSETDKQDIVPRFSRQDKITARDSSNLQLCICTTSKLGTGLIRNTSALNIEAGKV